MIARDVLPVMRQDQAIQERIGAAAFAHTLGMQHHDMNERLLYSLGPTPEWARGSVTQLRIGLGRLFTCESSREPVSFRQFLVKNGFTE